MSGWAQRDAESEEAMREYFDSLPAVVEDLEGRVAELEKALKPFADAWGCALRVAPTATLGQIGAVAGHEVSGVHYKNAAMILEDNGK